MKQEYLHNVAQIEYDANKCIGCKMCTIVCPHEVFIMRNKQAVLHNKNGCIECGACMINCIADAIRVKTGVGCATAIINNMIKSKNGEVSCDCG